MQVVQGSQIGEEKLVGGALPALSGGVAIKDAAAERASRMDRACAVDLKRAAVHVGQWGGSQAAQALLIELVEQPRGFEAGDVESMAVGVEPAALAASPAGWCVAGDIGGELRVDVA